MSRSRFSRSVYEAIRGAADHAAEAYRRHQTTRALEGLPDYIRNDIGLPRRDQFGRAWRRPF